MEKYVDSAALGGVISAHTGKGGGRGGTCPPSIASPGVLALLLRNHALHRLNGCPAKSSILPGPQALHFLGANELPLRQGSGCAKTLGRRCAVGEVAPSRRRLLPGILAFLLRDHTLHRLNGCPAKSSILPGPQALHFLGANELPLRQGFGCAKTLGRRCAAGRQPRPVADLYQASLPFSSGITRFIASMATSSMESSGSLVVKFCIHIPGRARKFVTGLS